MTKAYLPTAFAFSVKVAMPQNLFYTGTPLFCLQNFIKLLILVV
jgi:hypothetical protein